MAMSRDDFKKQYKAFQPDASDEEIDRLYDEAMAIIDKGRNFFDSHSKGSDQVPTKVGITKEDLAKVDWQAFGEVMLSSTIQRYLNYYILKHAASRVLGRKVAFREVYFAAMAIRSLARIVTEVGVSRVHIETEAVQKLKTAMGPITKK